MIAVLSCRSNRSCSCMTFCNLQDCFAFYRFWLQNLSSLFGALVGFGVGFHLQGLSTRLHCWRVIFWTLAPTPVFYVAPFPLIIVLFLWLKLDFMFSCTAGVAAHWCKTAYSKSKKYPSARLETWEEPYLYNIQACNVKSALTENDKYLTWVLCL